MGGSTFDPPIGPPGYARLIAPHRRPYATKDGFLCVLIYNDKHWRNFFHAVGRQDLEADARFCDHTSRAANIREVYEFVSDIMATRTTAEWRDLLEKADIPNTPMHTMASLIDDPHLNAAGFFPMYAHPSEGQFRTTAPVGEWSATPLSIRRLAPRLGEHSSEVLAEAGFSETQIQSMFASGATSTS
jgi:crotonobetainyl-CoA:carnitine CoA-transferase CaiB-like acyl-CoA transferase